MAYNIDEEAAGKVLMLKPTLEEIRLINAGPDMLKILEKVWVQLNHNGNYILAGEVSNVVNRAKLGNGNKESN